MPGTLSPMDKINQSSQAQLDKYMESRGMSIGEEKTEEETVVNNEEKTEEIKDEGEKNENEEETETEENEEEDLQSIASDRFKNRFKKVNQEKNEWKEKYEKLQAELENKPNKEESEEIAEPSEDEEDKLIQEKMKKLGYLTQADIDARRQEEQDHTEIQTEVKKLSTELDSIGEEFPGLFDRKEVVSHMRDKGLTDPRAAFFALNYKKIEAISKNNRGYGGMAGHGSSQIQSGSSAKFGESPKSLRELSWEGSKRMVEKYLAER